MIACIPISAASARFFSEPATYLNQAKSYVPKVGGHYEKHSKTNQDFFYAK